MIVIDELMNCWNDAEEEWSFDKSVYSISPVEPQSIQTWTSLYLNLNNWKLNLEPEPEQLEAEPELDPEWLWSWYLIEAGTL